MTSRAGIRLFVQAPLSPGVSLIMEDPHVHYLRNVLRRSEGDRVELFNGRDGQWRARIAVLDRRGGSYVIESRTREQAAEDGPWLLIAPVKRARLDLIVEKATELGVARICPVSTARTNSERVNLERLASIAIEASEQCNRLTVPEITSAEALSQVLATWDVTRRLYLLDETGSGLPVGPAFASHPHDTGAALLIGPEGGFDQSELDAMKILPFVNALDLGKRILRAETAALAALACFQAIAGDWATDKA